MTYDPFSYGQVDLKGEGEARSDSPDDMLFEDAGPLPDPTFGAEDDSSDWELPDASAGPLLEELCGPDGAEPAGTPQSAIAPAPPGKAPGLPDLEPDVTARAGAEVIAKPSVRRRVVATRPLPRRGPQGPRRVLGALVPPLCFVAGAGGAAWFYLVGHNIALAGIVAVTGVIGTAFTRLLFR